VATLSKGLGIGEVSDDERTGEICTVVQAPQAVIRQPEGNLVVEAL